MEKVCPPHCNTSMYCVYIVRGKTDGWALFDEFLGRAEQNENGWMIHHFTAWRRLSHHLPVEAGHRCDDLATSVHSLIYRSFVVLFLLFLFVPIPSCILRNAQHFGSSNGTGLSLYFVPTLPWKCQVDGERHSTPYKRDGLQKSLVQLSARCSVVPVASTSDEKEMACKSVGQRFARCPKCQDSTS